MAEMISAPGENIGTIEAWQAAADQLGKPQTVQQKRALATAYSRLGKPLEALKVLSTGDVDENLRRQTLKEAVDGLLALHADRKFKELLESAAVLAEADPREPRVLYLQADALEALEEDDRAAALRAKALELNGDAEAAHFTAGEMLMKTGARRLAEKEWLTILRIPPAADVYDINAWMRLGTIYDESRLYARAADAIEKGLAAFVAARDAGKGMGIAGGSEEDLRRQIETLRDKAKQQPAAPDAGVVDRVAPEGIHLNVNVDFKDGKIDEYRRALADSVAQVDVNVQPAGVRIFDVAPASLRYDAARKNIVILLNGSPCGEPTPFEGKEGKFRVIVRSLDCCYVYEFDGTGGEGKKLATYEKDYAVRASPRSPT
jgi:tetratricopeptide (TPR) repeat protein